MNNLIIIDDSVCRKELKEFVDKYSQQIKLLFTEEEYNINLDDLIQKLKEDFAYQKIVFIATKKDILKLSVHEILFIHSDEKGIFITLSNGETHQLTKSLIHYKINLKLNDILQVNDQSLINMNAIKAYSFQDNTLHLKGDYQFKVGSEYKNQIINAINKIDN